MVTVAGSRRGTGPELCLQLLVPTGVLALHCHYSCWFPKGYWPLTVITAAGSHIGTGPYCHYRGWNLRPFNHECGALTAELFLLLFQSAAAVAPVTRGAPAQTAPSINSAKVKDWAAPDVKEWLKKFGLDG